MGDAARAFAGLLSSPVVLAVVTELPFGVPPRKTVAVLTACHAAVFVRTLPFQSWVPGRWRVSR